MKIEKLRNNHKKEIIIGTILTIVIGGALTFRLTHSKYRVTQSIDLGSGTINYKPYDFKIMAMYQQKDESTCTEDNCYTEITDRMPSSGYVINTSKSYCTLDNVNHDNEAKVYTYEGKHVFENLKKSDKCYLYFDKYVPTASETILANLGTNIKTTAPDFSKIATTDEGVYQTTDEMYNETTYYWRGAATTNHVIFANKCWRIVRINGDKTVRLIYNGDVLDGDNKCFGNGANTNSIAVTSQAYNSSYDKSYYVGWTQDGTRRTNSTAATPSNAKTQTENWYKDTSKGNLTAYENKIADGKFCNDRNIDVPSTSSGWGTNYTTTWGATGTRFAYAGAKRLHQDYIPTFNCPSGDIYTLKVGAITADEVAFAGGKNGANDQYYLYNGQYYWTMSPYYWDGNNARVFFVHSNGELYLIHVDYTDPGLRPVINLRSDTIFATGGTGTTSNPYAVQ